MLIESRLSRAAYVQISLFRHLTRPIFYLFTLIGAGMTAYVITTNADTRLYFAAWVPLAMYALLGAITIILNSRGPNRPFLQMTRHEFGEQSVKIGSRLGDGEIPYRQIRLVRKLAGCYIFDLASGQFFAIPQASVRGERAKEFEQLLRERIRPTPNPIVGG